MFVRRLDGKRKGEVLKVYGEISYTYHGRKEHFYLIEGNSANQWRAIENTSSVTDFKLHFIDVIADKDPDFSAHYKWVKIGLFHRVKSENNQEALALLKEDSPW